METLNKNTNTVGQLRDALKSVPDTALLNIGNDKNGFSVDAVHYDGISVALVTKEAGVFVPVTENKLEAAKRCLIDNGIDADEAESVLQALGYILLDTELVMNEKPKDVPKEIEPEIGMTGTIKMDAGVKRSLWGKSFVIVGLNEGYASCIIEGKTGTYAIPKDFMKDLSFSDKVSTKDSLSNQIQAAAGRTGTASPLSPEGYNVTPSHDR